MLGLDLEAHPLEPGDLLNPTSLQRLERRLLDGRPVHGEAVAPGDGVVAPRAHRREVKPRLERAAELERHAARLDLGDGVPHDERIDEPVVEVDRHVAVGASLREREARRLDVSIGQGEARALASDLARSPRQVEVDERPDVSVRRLELSGGEARRRREGDVDAGQAEAAGR